MDKELTKLGLTETEAKVYVAVLGLGPSSASVIAIQSGVKRPTTYAALEHLIKEGLVSEVADSKEKKFKAEEPDRLTKLTRKMRRKVIDAELELEKLLPGLKSIQKKMVEAPKVAFYQGIEGIKTIILEASEYPEPWYYFGPIKEWTKAWSEKELDEFVVESRELRKKAGRPTSFLITDAGYNKIRLFQKNEPNIRQVKILPDLVKSKSAFIIFGKKLAVIGISGVPFGAVIESAEAVELVKMMFMMIWENLK